MHIASRETRVKFDLEFRCYFCDELKDEDDPFLFGISALKKEPVCRRCREKMEVVRRLKEDESAGLPPNGQKKE